MQTCTIFATYTNWLSRELEKADPDLSGTTRPPNMTPEQWKHFQSIRSQKHTHHHHQPPATTTTTTSTHTSQNDPNSSAIHAGGTAGGADDGGNNNNNSNSTTYTNTNKTGDARMAELFDVIRKWETNFSRHLQILLDALNHYAATETVVLLSLCARLSTANQGTEYAGLRSDEDVAGVV